MNGPRQPDHDKRAATAIRRTPALRAAPQNAAAREARQLLYSSQRRKIPTRCPAARLRSIRKDPNGRRKRNHRRQSQCRTNSRQRRAHCSPQNAVRLSGSTSPNRFGQQRFRKQRWSDPSYRRPRQILLKRGVSDASEPHSNTYNFAEVDKSLLTATAQSRHAPCKKRRAAKAPLAHLSSKQGIKTFKSAHPRLPTFACHRGCGPRET